MFNKKLYPNGFMISLKNEYNIPVYYKHEKLLNKFNLYYDPVYKFNYYTDENNFVYVHGHFKHSQYDSVSLSNEELLPRLVDLYVNNYNKFLDILDFIGGRYCIIIGDIDNFEVFQDATGARSVYYSTDNDVISSHLYLINDVIDCKQDKYSKFAAYAKVSFDNTPYSNVKALLPNFKLNFNSKKMERFFPRTNNKYSHLDDIKKVDIIESLWKQQLDYYYKEYRNVIVSITGGIDSRISLALCKNYLNNLQFFTYSKNPDYIDRTNIREQSHDKDRIIVEQILDDVEINHNFIYYNNEDLILNDSIKQLLSKNSIISHARYLINLYNVNFSNNYYMHLRGTCLEIVKSVYLNEDIDSISNRSVQEIYLNLAKNQFKYLNKNKFEELSLNSIDKLGYRNDHHDFAVQDLFYWEHRMGRWHPELLNETDLAFDTFLPFNLRSILEIGLSFSFNKRKTDYLFKELINKNYPILNFYGVNNTSNLYEQLKSKVKTEKSESLIHDSLNNNFYLYSKKKNQYDNSKLKNNTIKIPKDFLREGNFAAVDYKVKSDLANVELSILSEYKKENANNFLSYQLLLNDKVLLNEDISKWNFANHINVFNLVKNDIITIKINCHKNLYYKSWELASEIKIQKCIESPISKKIFTKSKIMYTSPFSH